MDGLLQFDLLTDNNIHGSTLIYVPTSITTPTATWSFAYEQSPGQSSSYITGRIDKITYPSGGYIAYTYSQNGDTDGQNGYDCDAGIVPEIEVEVNDDNGNDSKYWTFANSARSGGANPVVTETDPAGNQTVYNFAGEYETQVAYYQGSATGTTLKTVVTCYNANFSSCATPSTVPVLPFSQTDVYTSYNGGPSNLVET